MLHFSILTIGTFVTILDAICIYIARASFSKDIKKIIPIFSIIFGIILGIAGYYTPDVEMGSNLVEAIFIGLSAGAAATGVNQISKQLGKSMPIIIPYWLTKCLALIGDMFGTKAIINSNRLSKLTSTLTFSNAKAKKELGWEPMSVIDNFRIFLFGNSTVTWSIT